MENEPLSYKSEEEKQAALEFENLGQPKINSDNEEQVANDPRRMKIFLGRHGEAEHNIAEVPYFVGGSKEYDLPLTEKGIESAKKMAEVLKNEGIQVIIHSDLQRSRQTAEIIAESLSGVDLIELEGLRELDAGGFTGKTRDEIRNFSQDYQQRLDDFLSGDARKINFPDGENYETASKRIEQSIKEIITKYSNQKVAVIGHHNTNKILLSLLFPNEIDFIRQLNISHEGLVAMDLETDKQDNLINKNFKVIEGEDSKGLM